MIWLEGGSHHLTLHHRHFIIVKSSYHTIATSSSPSSSSSSSSHHHTTFISHHFHIITTTTCAHLFIDTLVVFLVRSITWRLEISKIPLLPEFYTKSGRTTISLLFVCLSACQIYYLIVYLFVCFCRRSLFTG